MTVTPQHKLLVTCPCLNVKLHLAAEPEKGTSLAGKELKLGLAGVSVEQKILCSLSISKDLATVRCSNCDRDVYSFKPSSSSVNLESTSLAYLSGSALYSPANGIVTPSDAVLTGQDIDALIEDPNYSKAFRLVLAPTSISTSTSSSTIGFTPSDPNSSNPSPVATTTSATPKQPEFPYRPHLERVRTILEKELETNLNAQQLRTEAKIEAYKSQQLLALQQSIETTKREKERLWYRIQERAVAPPPPTSTSESGAQGNIPDGSSDATGSQNLLEIPGTLPVRFTSASPLLDRRKSSTTDAAMSLQFREFDQRLVSNSMRRQSLIPAQIEIVNNVVDQTQSNTAANANTSTFDDQSSSSAANSGTSTPTGKSKKKVTISDAIRRVSIVEPENIDDVDLDELVEDEAEDDDDDEGVVFDLDEELGFDDEESRVENDENDEDDEDSNNGPDADDNDGGDSQTNGISFSSGRSLPKSGGMVVGSLRANYLRRQKVLQQHKQSLNDDELDFDEDVDDDYVAPSASDAMFLGTSLPIQIQPRAAALPPPPAPTTRTTAIANSLALPPGSSPAAAMLQRRLSRAYGADLPSEISNNAKTAAATTRSALTGSSYIEGSSSYIKPTTAALAGTVIIDPLMLLEEEHDNDDREDRIRNHRQPFSAVNNRRDMEKNLQNQQDQNSMNNTSSSSSSSLSGGTQQQTNFEPPHLYSARTYVGSTPWEMPTRVTVKSGGIQREGYQLDKQIEAELAKELELERLEKEKSLNGLSLDNNPDGVITDGLSSVHPFSTVVGSTSNDTKEQSDS